jgi:hypothetical protein
MSHKTAIAVSFFGLLTALNVGILLFNTSQPSRAAVAGMKAQALLKDPDFATAVKAIANKCRVNIELAKLTC